MSTPTRTPSQRSSNSFQLALPTQDSPEIDVTPKGQSPNSAGTPSGNKHSRYYFSDGNIIFLVEGTLYKVHRYFFQRDSSVFASMFSDSGEMHGQGGSDDDPISLDDVTVKDFDRFLCILYPALPIISDFRVRTPSTIDEWESVLDLAAKWNFQSIKLLAIEHITEIGSSIDKIVIGRRHGVIEWLGEAYEAVCTRKEPLTQQEGIRLGVENVVRISAVRQVYGLGVPRYEPVLLSSDLSKIFGLDKMQQEHHGTSDDDGDVEVKRDDARIAFESVDVRILSPSAFSAEVSDSGGPREMKPTERSPLRSLTKMKKRKDSQRRLEELQQKQAREQEQREQEARRREQAAREIQARREQQQREHEQQERVAFFM